MSSSPLLRSEERDPMHDDRSPYTSVTIRRQVYRFLNSRTAHYAVLALVTLDVGCLFADIVINLLTCGHQTHTHKDTLKALEIVGLVFSCLFILELLASIWAFGKTYFRSKFHIFDATVIVVSFIVEVALQGITEEVASLIVILRLLRVVKIVDEFSVGAEEQMKDLETRVEELKRENVDLKNEIELVKSRSREST